MGQRQSKDTGEKEEKGRSQPRNPLWRQEGVDIACYDWVVHFDDFESLQNHGCGISVSAAIHNELDYMLGQNKLIPTQEVPEVPIPPELLDNFTIDDNFSVVSVLGLFDKGKTWLLNKLCNVDLPTGYTVHTQGLSFKLPPGVGEADSNVVLLDTAGSYSPVENASLRAIGMKKASETFLKEIAIRLSDKVFVVVNELTWPDQEFIEALLSKFNAFTQFSNEYLVVIHNYKSIEKWRDFKKQKKFYVKNCYNVDRKSKAWADNPKAVAKWLDVKDQRLSHVFLAKEGSPAGKKVNGPTIKLLQEWMWKRVPRRAPLVKRLMDLCETVLSSFTSHVSPIEFYACHDLAYPFLLKSRDTSDDDGNRPHMTKEPRLNDGDFSISFADSFVPKADTIRLRNALLIICELPGYSPRGGITDPLKQEFRIRFDIPREELVITGPKQLCYIPYAEDWTLLDDKRQVYSESDTFNMHQREVSPGWELKVPIPRTFQKKWHKVSFRDGILQVVVLEEPQDNSDSIVLS